MSAGHQASIRGFHSIRYFYDEKDRVSRLEYFDTAGVACNAQIIFSASEIIDFQKMELIYTGDNLTREKLYAANSNTPAKIIDCTKSDYVVETGLGTHIRNPDDGGMVPGYR